MDSMFIFFNVLPEKLVPNMACRKMIVICQSGGKFTTASDGSLSYTGGEAHAISVSKETLLQELVSEVAEMWKYNTETITIKYFLPNNRRTLITISSDKDIQRMIDFHEDAATIDVYVMTGDIPINNFSLVPCSGSSRTTIAAPSTPLDFPFPTIADTDAGENGHTSYNLVDGEGEYQTPISFADVAVEFPTPLAMAEDGDTGQHKLPIVWKNCITGLHQQFNSVQDLRDALRKYSAAHGFLYTYKNNDGQRLTAKCKIEGCPWRLHASKLATTQLFRIKKLNDVHTCGQGTSPSTRPQASKKLIVGLLKEKLRDSPHSKPREIADEIRRDFGIELRYYQAWRGIESVRVEIQGSYKDSFNQLPLLCEKIMETNPGSVTTLISKEDLSFHRLFVAFHASLHGFQNGCRPLIFLDTLTLKSKFQSELLIASALDGNDDVFPVAFAVVDVVNDDNWHWFLVQLRSALQTFVEPITFVADRKMGLRMSISSIFEHSYHGFCLQHLTEELSRNLKGPITKDVFQVIVSHLYEAAYAATTDVFSQCLQNIKNISPEAYDWIFQNEPEHWASAYFQGSRYNHITSGIARSFYSGATEAPVLPVTQMLDSIRCQIMELIYTRRNEANQWLTKLSPMLEDKLQKDIVGASTLQVLFSRTDDTFDVPNHLGGMFMVNINTMDCTCKEWSLTGLPCLHALAVLQRFDKNIYDYCSKYFLTETFRSVYSESINPIPTGDKSEKEPSEVQVNPPPLRNPSGEPKKRRDRSKGQIKRPLHCSRCKGVGHNRATCHIPS